jgi:hypothetical protein
VAVRVKEDVLWLQITVNNIQVVQESDCRRDLCGVEPSAGHWEPLLLLKVEEKLASVDIVQHKVPGHEKSEDDKGGRGNGWVEQEKSDTSKLASIDVVQHKQSTCDRDE